MTRLLSQSFLHCPFISLPSSIVHSDSALNLATGQRHSFLSLSKSFLLPLLSAHDVPQPDNAEYLLNPSLATVEACLAINNNWYGDGVAWHDTACYRKKPFICEDSDVLMRRARALNPQIFA